ncbi:hypothetical protein [Alcanivorax borkumensis]|uniref:hypothetical protein n=1 Tax=Alcanivorax borkumensis TaxID=59754 RepID=UPI0035616F60
MAPPPSPIAPDDHRPENQYLAMGKRPLGTADAGNGGIGTVFLSILQPPPKIRSTRAALPA